MLSVLVHATDATLSALMHASDATVIMGLGLEWGVYLVGACHHVIEIKEVS